jgi:translation initiation factor IF-3
MEFNKQESKPRRDFGPRKNEYIRVPQVMVIDEKGENIGILDTDVARAKAVEAGLDLVEVGATAKPPVCRIMDYSKYLYEQKKKQRKSKKLGKVKEMKELRFSTVIDSGDMDTRVRRAKEFLDKGHSVRITVTRKGRQTYEQSKQVLEQILTNFTEYSSIDPEPKNEGRRISITFKKNGKTKDK